MEGIPERFLAGIEEIHDTLGSFELRRQLARLVAREEMIYRNACRNNYFADRLAIDVLTDTTERSPTFCLPAFRKSGDPDASESTSFIFLPEEDSEAAWRRLLQRELQPVEWDRESIRSLIGEAGLERQHRLMKTIRREEILRFHIGLEGLAERPFRPGDSACAILAEDDLSELTEEGGFFRLQLDAAHKAGSSCSVLVFGREAALGEAARFHDGWQVPALRVLVRLPEDRMRLQGPGRVAAKMLLNALSTLTMVRLGRVKGNFMIWVVPSNLKLIDRATRYIQHFTGLSYEDACHLLHRAIEHVAPRMQAGKEYPSVVAMCLIVSRDGCSFEEAERQRTD